MPLDMQFAVLVQKEPKQASGSKFLIDCLKLSKYNIEKTEAIQLCGSS